MADLTIQSTELRKNLTIGTDHEYDYVEVFGALEDSQADGGAVIAVLNGGNVSNIQVNGTNLGEGCSSLSLQDGATGSTITVGMYGEMQLRDSQTSASGIEVNQGELTVWNGASAENVEIGNGGKATVSTNATVNDLQLNGGAVTLKDAVIDGATVSAGSLKLLESVSTATLRNCELVGGTLSDGATVNKSKSLVDGLIIGENGSAKFVNTVKLTGEFLLRGALTIDGTATADNLNLVLDLADQVENMDSLLEIGGAFSGTATVNFKLDSNNVRGSWTVINGLKDSYILSQSAYVCIGDKKTPSFLGEPGWIIADYCRVNIGLDKSGNVSVTVDNLSEALASDKYTWSSGLKGCVAEISTDKSFGSSVCLAETSENGFELIASPQSLWWRVVDAVGNVKQAAKETGAGAISGDLQLAEGNFNGLQDVYFAMSNDKWESGYAAVHAGDGVWKGTGEQIDLEGMNRFTDICVGGGDDFLLVLTDGNDALFVDDIYTDSVNNLGETHSRIVDISEINAGAGDDLIDLTSRTMPFDGEEILIHGGDGNDIIWGGYSANHLCGDAGNDTLVGGSLDDILDGGTGNDTLVGGGGNDRFIFCANWGQDKVSQLAGGTITLCFDSSIDTKSLNKSVSGNNTVIIYGNNRITLENWRGEFLVESF